MGVSLFKKQNWYDVGYLAKIRKMYKQKWLTGGDSLKSLYHKVIPMPVSATGVQSQVESYQRLKNWYLITLYEDFCRTVARGEFVC